MVSESDPWFEQGASANLFAGRFRNFVVARCRGQGLNEGTAAFSTCMLDSQDRGAAMSSGPVKLAYDTSTPENSKSYFDVSNRVHWRREQYACAQIGLTPGTAAFGACMAGLEAALMPNPF